MGVGVVPNVEVDNKLSAGRRVYPTLLWPCLDFHVALNSLSRPVWGYCVTHTHTYTHTALPCTCGRSLTLHARVCFAGLHHDPGPHYLQASRPQHPRHRLPTHRSGACVCTRTHTHTQTTAGQSSHWPFGTHTILRRLPNSVHPWCTGPSLLQELAACPPPLP